MLALVCGNAWNIDLSLTTIKSYITYSDTDFPLSEDFLKEWKTLNRSETDVLGKIFNLQKIVYLVIQLRNGNVWQLFAKWFTKNYISKFYNKFFKFHTLKTSKAKQIYKLFFIFYMKKHT